MSIYNLQLTRFDSEMRIVITQHQQIVPPKCLGTVRINKVPLCSTIEFN